MHNNTHNPANQMSFHHKGIWDNHIHYKGSPKLIIQAAKINPSKLLSIIKLIERNCNRLPWLKIKNQDDQSKGRDNPPLINYKYWDGDSNTPCS